jgi:hypothetical protein
MTLLAKKPTDLIPSLSKFQYEKRNKVGEVIPSGFSTYCKAAVIKTLWKENVL